MKYCYHCNHFTTGEPVFCNFCGRSYDVKLCPRLHVNSRISLVCSQCGSRDLSTPQPKVPFFTRLFVVAVTFVLGTLLISLMLLFVGVFLEQLVLQTNVLNDLVGIGIMLLLLWWIWIQLPIWMRKTIYKMIHGKQKDKTKSKEVRA